MDIKCHKFTFLERPSRIKTDSNKIPLSQNFLFDEDLPNHDDPFAQVESQSILDEPRGEKEKNPVQDETLHALQVKKKSKIIAPSMYVYIFIYIDIYIDIDIYRYIYI